MKLLYDDDLVENVVAACAGGTRPGAPPLQIRRFHAERERCYATLDPDERSAAFARVQTTWFVEWGIAEELTALTRQFPRLDGALEALVFRQSRRRTDEGGELYCDPEGNRRGILALHPDRFNDRLALARFVNHELGHLEDMVDPRFGYFPDLGLEGVTVSHQRLVRERYRLLWDVSVDGRLTGRGLATVADEAKRRKEFDRGFAFLEEGRRSELFAALWSGRTARHEQLLEVATDPRALHEQRAAIPGASCPLCGFAAFQWADAASLRLPARERMQSDFPGWRPGEAVCARCAEMYDVIVGLEYPATVCL